MNTVKVEGVVYTKAAILAKEFHYTTDYIGQLCRSGKVDCQLVGRAWYVSESSLLSHKDSRYKENRVNEKTININNNFATNSNEIKVHPRLKGVAAKQSKVGQKHFLGQVGASQSVYFNDERELLPQPLKEDFSETIVTEVAEPIVSIKPIKPIIPASIVIKKPITKKVMVYESKAEKTRNNHRIKPINSAKQADEQKEIEQLTDIPNPTLRMEENYRPTSTSTFVADTDTDTEADPVVTKKNYKRESSVRFLIPVALLCAGSLFLFFVFSTQFLVVTSKGQFVANIKFEQPNLDLLLQR